MHHNECCYKVGDMVRIVDEWAKGSPVNDDGRMDKWRGHVMTIRRVIQGGVYKMEEDSYERGGEGWYWHEDMIAGLAGNLADSAEADEAPTDELVGFFESITII